MNHSDHAGLTENLVERSLPESPRRPATLLVFPAPLPYADTWALQRRLHAERIADFRPDILLLLEHEPIYTMGRRTQLTHWSGNEHLLRELGATLQTVDRGGSITYHGPGQLIGYPIMKLSGLCPGPKTYVRMLEQVLIDVLAFSGIDGHRVEKKPGIWVRTDGAEAKLASIGVRLDCGVTMHGFALNINLDLSPFSHIVPCGLDGCRMTSMAEVRQQSVDATLVAQQIARCFADTFNIEWRAPSSYDMRTGTIDRSIPAEAISPT